MPAIDHITEPIRSVDALREILEPPIHFVTDKEVSELDEICRDFISRSPFVLIASTDGKGRVDVSPKGDSAGFVEVLDDTTLAIPDRPGNHRNDTFLNVLEHPHVGLIFLVPGTKTTLRLRGRATIARDLWLRERLAVDGKVPDLALIVEVTTAYLHCAKCIIRSKLWSHGAPGPDDRLLATAMVEHGGLPLTVEDMHAFIVDDEVNRLY